MSKATVDFELLDRIAPSGTIANRVVNHLLDKPAGTEMPAAEIADLVGLDSAGVSKMLLPSARAGLLVCRKEGRNLLWRLAGTQPSGDSRRPDEEEGPSDERVVNVIGASMAPSVFAYAQQRFAAPFSVAMSTDGRLTIERHGRVVCELTDQERRQLIVAATNGVAAP